MLKAVVCSGHPQGLSCWQPVAVSEVMIWRHCPLENVLQERIVTAPEVYQACMQLQAKGDSFTPKGVQFYFQLNYNMYHNNKCM